MPAFGGTLDVGLLPIGVKAGEAVRPFAPIVFHAEALVGAAVVGAVLVASAPVGFGLARVGMVEIGRFAAKPDVPVLAHPVNATVMRIPAHVPVWLDIVTPSRLNAELASEAAGH
jgi:hypothetical protein